jgi:hypothetical protein
VARLTALDLSKNRIGEAGALERAASPHLVSVGWLNNPGKASGTAAQPVTTRPREDSPRTRATVASSTCRGPWCGRQSRRTTPGRHNGLNATTLPTPG